MSIRDRGELVVQDTTSFFCSCDFEWIIVIIYEQITNREHLDFNILWDFDGTLFDTYPVYTKILKKVLGKDIAEEKIYKQLKTSFTHAIQFFQLSKEQINAIDVLESKILSINFPPFLHVEEVLKFADTNVINT